MGCKEPSQMTERKESPLLLFARKSQFLIRPFDQLFFGRLVFIALIFGWIFFGLAARVTWSHPLGNFSLNHYNSLEIYPNAIITQHVLDFAEIPSYNELTRVDTSGDNNVSPEELRKYKETLHSRFNNLTKNVPSALIGITT